MLPEHAFPLAHAAQLAPPQSVSVSVPFLTPSLQLELEHRLAVHTPLTQSEPIPQILPETQAEQLISERLDQVVEGTLSPYEVASEVLDGLKQGARL